MLPVPGRTLTDFGGRLLAKRVVLLLSGWVKKQEFSWTWGSLMKGGGPPAKIFLCIWRVLPSVSKVSSPRLRLPSSAFGDLGYIDVVLLSVSFTCSEAPTLALLSLSRCIRSAFALVSLASLFLRTVATWSLSSSKEISRGCGFGKFAEPFFFFFFLVPLRLDNLPSDSVDFLGYMMSETVELLEFGLLKVVLVIFLGDNPEYFMPPIVELFDLIVKLLMSCFV